MSALTGALDPEDTIWLSQPIFTRRQTQAIRTGRRHRRQEWVTTASTAILWHLQISLMPRHSLITEAAYHQAPKRGFAAGEDWQDWFAVEHEVDGLLDPDL
jgi:hypothetical protein